MVRLRLVSSRTSDPDVESHLATLSCLPRVLLADEGTSLEDSLPLIVRHAFQTLWHEDADILLTVGEAALVAASMSWRGPLVHLPVGRITGTERRLLCWRSPAHTLCVFASHLAASDAIRMDVPSELTRVIRTAPVPCTGSRNLIRERLGIQPDATCVLLNGRIRSIGGHRTALLTSAVLAFRDPDWRILIDAGDHQDYVRRFFESSSQPQTLVIGNGHSPAELVAVSDVVVVDDLAIPSLVGIASAAAARVPIVASTRLWQREQLQHVPALLMNTGTARYWARAVLESLDGAQRPAMDRLAASMASNVAEPTLRHQWLEVLHTVCGRTQEGLVPHAPLQASP